MATDDDLKFNFENIVFYKGRWVISQNDTDQSRNGKPWSAREKLMLTILHATFGHLQRDFIHLVASQLPRGWKACQRKIQKMKLATDVDKEKELNTVCLKLQNIPTVATLKIREWNELKEIADSMAYFARNVVENWIMKPDAGWLNIRHSLSWPISRGSIEGS